MQNQKPDHLKEDELVVKWQLAIFSLALLLAWFVGPLVPKIWSEVVYKIVDMLFVCGTILLAVKLAREGWDMAAAGYTILGIGWGIFFAANDFNHLHIDMEIRTSAAYFLMPCMSLLLFYKPFPLWLKILTLCSMLPYVISLILFKIDEHYEKTASLWLELGFGLFHLTSVFWGVFFYRQHLKFKKNVSADASTQTISANPE